MSDGSIFYFCILSLSLSLSLSLIDKCTLLVDFVAQIKANADTAQLFESIQADASITITTPTAAGMEPMELS